LKTYAHATLVDRSEIEREGLLQSERTIAERTSRTRRAGARSWK
jgi:hypothetical protein